MPPSGKRGPRGVKREILHSDDTPIASPTRPSKRKKTLDKKEEIEERVETVLPETQDDIDMDEPALIDAVSAHLLLCDPQTVVSIDNNNSKAKPVHMDAYAKITGRDWTFYVKRDRLNIGRPPEGFYPATPADEASRTVGEADEPSSRTPRTPAESNQGVGLPADPTEPSRIHIDLGPSKVVSRLHAEIYYSGQPTMEGWFIIVNGRNGIKVDESPVRRGQTARLHSGSVIEIAGTEMMFCLPASEHQLEIAAVYLRRAGLIQPFFKDQAEQDRWDAMHGRPTSTNPNGIAGQLPIAPAPPDYRRPDTPVRQRGRGAPSSTPRGSGLTFVDSENADLSLKASENIKPSFTYSQLISQAILSTKDHKATLATIYDFVKDKYAYYRRAGTEKGWQNSIRHNLSLNAGFELSPRETHEPGKGGYWTFKSGRRADLIAEAWGKARRSPNKKSSSPNSPGGKPKRAVHGPGDVDGGSPVRKVKRSPRDSQSPRLGSYPPNAPQFTPDQGRFGSSVRDELPGDGSPLPRKSRQGNSMYGFSDNIQGSPPVLSSSYAIDEAGSSLITPAPQRKRPILAPPSTAQRPSQHMPTSSPAPFWRYADLSMGTPLRLDMMSPTKDSHGHLQSSSPPRPDINGSPSRPGGDVKGEIGHDQDEEPAFDLSKRFTSISKFHAANNSNGFPIASTNGRH